jgi:hypothetical protein
MALIATGRESILFGSNWFLFLYFHIFYALKLFMIKTCKRNSIYTIIIGVLLIQGCMKKQCYTCTTTYPQLMSDTFSLADSVHSYCDITIEKAEVIENNGTLKREYTINGKPQIIETKTTCE